MKLKDELFFLCNKKKKIKLEKKCPGTSECIIFLKEDRIKPLSDTHNCLHAIFFGHSDGHFSLKLKIDNNCLNVRDKRKAIQYLRPNKIHLISCCTPKMKLSKLHSIIQDV